MATPNNTTESPLTPTPIQLRAAHIASIPGMVRIRKDGSFSVLSSDGQRRYIVSADCATCTCKARRYANCKHREACRLIIAAIAKASAADNLDDMTALELSLSFGASYTSMLHAIQYRACKLVAERYAKNEAEAA